MAKTAIEAKRANLFMLDPDDIVVIGWDTEDGPEHPLWDARAKLPVDEKLVANIVALQRIIHPIKVRKNGDKVECVIGRQRVKAAREANKRLQEKGCEPVFIPATVARDEDHVSLGMIISENEQCQDDSPLERARKAQRYINLGRTEAEAAVMFGMSVPALRQYLALLDLDKSVQKMVEQRKLSASAAAGLAQLPREQQQEQAEKLVASGTATVADVKQAVRKHKGNNRVKAPGRKMLKYITAQYEESTSTKVSHDFIRGVLFCMGEIKVDDVVGLAALLEE